MDLQLHDGFKPAPKRRLSTARQILQASYGTPTYFKFIDDYGLSGDEDDLTLEFNMRDLIARHKALIEQKKAQQQPKPVTATPIPVMPKPLPVIENIMPIMPAPIPIMPTPVVPPPVLPSTFQNSSINNMVPFQTTAPGTTPPKIFTKDQLIDIGKNVGSTAFSGGTKEQVVSSLIQNVGSIIPGGGIVLGIGNAIQSAFGGGKQSTPEEAYNMIQKMRAAGQWDRMPKGIRSGFEKLASRYNPSMQPMVVATPTTIPMTGGSVASLGPVIPVMPESKPTGTFAGLDTKTLLLLAVGGFLAFKLLNK